MHGLILATPVPYRKDSASRLSGRLDAGSFGDHWPGRTRLDIAWSLESASLRLQVSATNLGAASTPIGIGWHPYFRLPSGERRQARLAIPALARVAVNSYDEVLPTGELKPVAGTPYDFQDPGGRPLGDLYLDDCFTQFRSGQSGTLVELRDPAAHIGLRLATRSSAVRALQVYAPPSESFVVLEPQFNLPDPFGKAWGGRDTGMVMMRPGQMVHYDVLVTAFVV